MNNAGEISVRIKAGQIKKAQKLGDWIKVDVCLLSGKTVAVVYRCVSVFLERRRVKVTDRHHVPPFKRSQSLKSEYFRSQ